MAEVEASRGRWKKMWVEFTSKIWENGKFFLIVMGGLRKRNTVIYVDETLAVFLCIL